MEFHKYTISKKGVFKKSFKIFQDDNLIYSIKSPGWLSNKQIHFTNVNNEVVLTIQRPFNFFQYTFEFYENGKLNGVLTKATLSNEYTLKSIYATYMADGNWLGNEYTVYLGEDDIAKVSRKMLSNKNQYGIAIIEGNHNLFILGMVISIEFVKMSRRSKST